MDAFIEAMIYNIQSIPFMISIVLIIMSLFCALINIAVAKNYTDDMSILRFGKRWVGAVLSLFVLLLVASYEPMLGISKIANGMIYLICIREITVALKFTGIDLTSLTFFIDLALKFVEKQGAKAIPEKFITGGSDEENKQANKASK